MDSDGLLLMSSCCTVVGVGVGGFLAPSTLTECCYSNCILWR